MESPSKFEKVSIVQASLPVEACPNFDSFNGDMSKSLRASDSFSFNAQNCILQLVTLSINLFNMANRKTLKRYRIIFLMHLYL